MADLKSLKKELKNTHKQVVKLMANTGREMKKLTDRNNAIISKISKLANNGDIDCCEFLYEKTHGEFCPSIQKKERRSIITKKCQTR